MKTITRDQAIDILSAAGYRVATVKGCRNRTGTGYLITGITPEGRQVNLGRLRQMAENIQQGREVTAG